MCHQSPKHYIEIWHERPFSLQLEEMKTRPVLLGACKLCPTLRSELDEKNALIKSFGKTKVVESSPPIDCSVCPSLIADLDSLAVEKADLENENIYLRAILSWVSSSEPQLGMMIKQFKRGDGFGVGHTYTKSNFDRLYGKIGCVLVLTVFPAAFAC